MKTIFNLLIAGLVVNATFHGGRAAWDYYELKDATQQLLTFGDRATTGAIRSNILGKAAQLNLPVSAQNVTVHRQGVRTWAEASYIQSVEFIPNYPYPVTFSFAVDNYSLTPGVQEDAQ